MVIVPQLQQYVSWSQRPDLLTIMEQSSGYFYCHLTISSNIRTPIRQIIHAITFQGIILFSYGATVPSVPGPHYRGFTLTLRHTAIGRTPLEKWSARRRDLYLTINDTHKRQTDIRAPSGIRNRNPSQREAAEPRLRPRGRWNRAQGIIIKFISVWNILHILKTAN